MCIFGEKFQMKTYPGHMNGNKLHNLFYQNYVSTKDLSSDISQYIPLIMKVFQKYPPPLKEQFWGFKRSSK